MIKVAVGVVFDDKQRILITQRAEHISHGGFWEFPGGKLEADELAEAALVREIKEEVGVDVLEYRFLGDLNHDYGTRAVHLFVFAVNKHQGEARRCELQSDLRWVAVEDLEQYQFPEANQQIIEMIKGCWR